MTLDNILKNGDVKVAKRWAIADYAVAVTKTRDGFNFYFSNENAKKFDGSRVVPIIIQNRVYFAREDKLNANGSHTYQGYKMTVVGDNKARKNNKFSTTHKEFLPFVGEYAKMHYDGDCFMWYIEKPKRF